jgi:hypothetical protein
MAKMDPSMFLNAMRGMNGGGGGAGPNLGTNMNSPYAMNMGGVGPSPNFMTGLMRPGNGPAAGAGVRPGGLFNMPAGGGITGGMKFGAGSFGPDSGGGTGMTSLGPSQAFMGRFGGGSPASSGLAGGGTGTGTAGGGGFMSPGMRRRIGNTTY